MNLEQIQKRLLFISPYVKEVSVTIQDGSPFALIYPNFEALKADHIINIEAEIKWYCVELYNMEVDESFKIRGYKISNNNDINKTEIEPSDKLYEVLKDYLSSLSDIVVLPSSHIELDLGLDSLNYVELFVFIEQSFGIYIDEIIFSKIMKVQKLYEYIKQHQTTFTPTNINWKKVLDEDSSEKLIYSPFIMYGYKTILLPLFKLYFNLEIIGKQNIPTSSCIIAPTHQSMLDGFLIVSSLPYNILKKSFFLAFKGVFGKPILGSLAKRGQTILIDYNYNLKSSMQNTALPLKDKQNLVIFPEGARTRDRKLLEFRPFFAMLSKTYNVPIVPVVIDGSFEALGSGKIFPIPKKIKITYLEPVYPDRLSYDEITTKVKDMIQDELSKTI